MTWCAGIGQDSHRFSKFPSSRPLKLGGITIPFDQSLEGNSDADVILHALCNAISGVSGTPVLGEITDQMCKEGTTDSAAYVLRAMETLNEKRIVHVSVSIECRVPKISPHIPEMRERIAEIVGLKKENIGITATSGEGLTDFGRGLGVQAFVIVTAETMTK